MKLIIKIFKKIKLDLSEINFNPIIDYFLFLQVDKLIIWEKLFEFSQRPGFEFIIISATFPFLGNYVSHDNICKK
jgi:hypothetical protein